MILPGKIASNNPNILDLRNIFNKSEMIKLGFNYKSIGKRLIISSKESVYKKNLALLKDVGNNIYNLHRFYIF